MSHLATSAFAIKNMESLARTCAKRQLELDLNTKEFKWYASKRSRCEAVIRIPGDDRAYEIGVIKNPNGEGYVLQYDFFCQNKLIQLVGGEECEGLIQDYSIDAAMQTQSVTNLKMLGYSESIQVEEETQDIVIVYEN